MIKLDIKNLKIARKYANALLETAKEVNIVDSIVGELNTVIDTITENKQLAKFLLNPVVKATDKKETTQKIFTSYISKTLLDFLYLLIDNNRLDILKEISYCYQKEYNEINNIVKPIIISAVELDDNQKTKVIQKISGKLSKSIEPVYEIDTTIIGGLIIKIEDKTIDCSLKTKFDNMKKQLTKGNSYGNY